MPKACAKRGWRRPVALVTAERNELFFVIDLFGLDGDLFVDYFEHEEEGPKQIWDGPKGMLSLVAVPVFSL